jgi:adenosylmethionine-8-amino-7-oxononanoate aminotransferase
MVVVTHGHRHPAIMEAIKATADRFDQIIFAELPMSRRRS